MIDAILITTHKINLRILHLYNKIRTSVNYYCDVFILIQKESMETLAIPFGIKSETFSKKDLFSLDMTPLREDITPGSNHFILLWFFKNHPKYDRYWVIEYDVEYSGNWKDVFEKTKSLDFDFMSTHIQHYAENPSWYWWGSLGGAVSDIPFRKRVRSFNPVMRIGRSAIEFLYATLLKDNNRGHHEELISTLLYNNSFSILDLGQNGKFASRELSPICSYNTPLPFGTMRHKPSFLPFDVALYPDKLIHPMKNSIPFVSDKIKR